VEYAASEQVEVHLGVLYEGSESQATMPAGGSTWWAQDCSEYGLQDVPVPISA
jgi:hypothetical protein